MTDRREEKPTGLLLNALGDPLRRELLRRYIEAGDPLGSVELARLTGQPLSVVRHHVGELARYQVILFAGEGERCGSVEDLYEASWWVRLTPWAMTALGLSLEEQRARLDQHIAERRKDTEFMNRLNRRLEEDRPILERLRESEEENDDETSPQK
jgi:hypothetical protein